MEKLLEIKEAERLAKKIQRMPEGNRMPCRLKGDLVLVDALPENAFRILSIPREHPERSGSYAFLEKTAEMDLNRISDGNWQYAAIVTWDTMIHGLLRTQELVPDRGKRA